MKDTVLIPPDVSRADPGALWAVTIRPQDALTPRSAGIATYGYPTLRERLEEPADEFQVFDFGLVPNSLFTRDSAHVTAMFNSGAVRFPYPRTFIRHTFDMADLGHPEKGRVRCGYLVFDQCFYGDEAEDKDSLVVIEVSAPLKDVLIGATGFAAVRRSGDMDTNLYGRWFPMVPGNEGFDERHELDSCLFSTIVLAMALQTRGVPKRFVEPSWFKVRRAKEKKQPAPIPFTEVDISSYASAEIVEPTGRTAAGRKPPKTHLRRGHWRELHSDRFKPETRGKRIWVDPMLVGADDLADVAPRDAYLIRGAHSALH